jgi:hypothetical protein
MNKACNWHYHHSNDLHIVFTSNSPYSGKCYTSINEPVNGIDSGIDDLTEYCQATYTNATDVAAAPTHGTNWACQKTINMKSACIWKSNRTDVEPREVSKGIWRCFVQDL